MSGDPEEPRIPTPATSSVRIDLALQADTCYVMLPRLVATTLASQLRFPEQSLACLREAVHHVCTTLLDHARAQATMTCAFLVTDSEVRFRVSVPCTARRERRPRRALARRLAPLAAAYDVAIDRDAGVAVLRTDVLIKR